MAESAPVIAIDGPTGTGKGTISQLLAVRLGWSILDSGALYRLLALFAERRSVSLGDEAALVGLVHELGVRFIADQPGEPVRVLLGDDDVSAEIRKEGCGAAASRLATSPRIRDALLELQRSFRILPGLVADGRDMGSVVFPDAALKIFLTASPEERARRRYKQLIGKGIDVNLASLLADIAERDKRDRERVTAPLKPAEGAVIVDTTDLDIGTVLDRVMTLISSRGLGID